MISKIKLAALVSLSLCILNVSAQERPVKISSKVNTDKSVELSYEKQDPGTFTVLVKFKDLTNTDGSNEQDFTIRGYSGNMLTLKPKDGGQGIGYSFGYTSIRGKFDPKYNANFIYALPYKAGSKVLVAQSGSAGEKNLGNPTLAEWKVYNFYSKFQDTVTAVRKGTVVEIMDSYESNPDVAYTTKSNSMIIEHVDGTLATYSGFKKGSFVVKVGQAVFPGTALGVNSQGKANNGFNIWLKLTYLKSIEIDRSKIIQNPNSLYGFITPHFSTMEDSNVILEAKKEYSASLPAEIFRKELTKKELKKQGVK